MKKRLSILLILSAALFIIIVSLIIPKIWWKYSANTSWISDLGYQEQEICSLKLDKAGIPEFPVSINDNTYYFSFDTGCASGFVVTNALQDKIEYSLLEQKEELNRDGSHRGWSNLIHLDSAQILQQEYRDITCSMIDWKMSSSYKFSGLLGPELFQKQLITLDYRAHKAGIKSTADYKLENMDEYVAVPILNTKISGQEHLIFFACKVNGEDGIAYIDTGKNISYIHNADSDYIIGQSNEKPHTSTTDVDVIIGDMSLRLKGLYEANMPQGYDFDNPVMIEINSDQLSKNDIVVTFDFINGYVLFHDR